MQKIQWGIIGCGDVTEVKSGPAFNKVPGSSLVAVMRRDAEKAADYARRHGVPAWYSNADDLINDPAVNAVYIATPPSSHKELSLLALAAGKPVYVEKPMSVNVAEAEEMAALAKENNVKLTVAHYRRAQPKFKKIKELLAQNVIGDIRFVQLTFCRKALTAEELSVPKTAWRVDATIAGGGLFHDIAPHQLDLMLYYFGEAETVNGTAKNQAGIYSAADIVSGQIAFTSGTLFSGTWCFAAAKEEDEIKIVGANGSLRFSAFGSNDIFVDVNGKPETYSFDELQHVQQPMIEQVVNYFSGNGSNPNTAEEGVSVMKWLEAMSG
ncbi:Gfo/Idh/MocA family protein [Ferruginibacter sp. HRS2-29]|uniref:Gfo/Idh/MocA family protein n=1 Tax=Ferruginibacter sp. HRS2-29 TaxID=2487334 RepID=UPI0020CCA2B2|nr:Gfo/Idh/MocA family oxidoreductase [Ferruginibacter sp. HRS2-29]MCP9751840.1 gfo/Idh/MocA family oxidoreductase [Ferruginibacter sp. HRS2-29]